MIFLKIILKNINRRRNGNMKTKHTGKFFSIACSKFPQNMHIASGSSYKTNGTETPNCETEIHIYS